VKIDGADRLNLVLLVLSLIVVGVLYDKLPDPMPTHWNIRGVADGFTPKPWGAFIGPIVMAAMILLLWLFPVISPRGFQIDPFRKVYGILKVSVGAFIFLINLAAVSQALEIGLPVERVIPALVGLLFVILGNFMGKLRKNFFVGIRTPWTLASDEVWLRTHRLGGVVFFWCGLLIFIGSLLGMAGGWLFGLIILAALVPVVYSFVFYRKIEAHKADEIS